MACQWYGGGTVPDQNESSESLKFGNDSSEPSCVILALDHVDGACRGG
jgi:hypothetical protein